MKNSESNEVIDLDALQKLKKLQKPGRPDLLTALINLYFETADLSMTEIRLSFEKQDLTAISSAAHSLKSSSANLGALNFAKLCLQIEQLSEAEFKSIDMVQKLKKHEEEYIKVIEELKGYKVVA